MPDSNITLRSVKGSPLSHSELDGNFREFFYSASVSGSEVRLYRSQSSNQYETINLSEPKGQQYSIQIKQGTADSGASIAFTGSKSLTYDFSSSVLTVTGSSFFNGGTIFDGDVTGSSSTNFGRNKGTDKHFRTGSYFVDGDFNITGRITSLQPITASIDWSTVNNKPAGIVSSSVQVGLEDTTGFGGLTQSISQSFAVSSSAHTQRLATTNVLSGSAHTQRLAISSSKATALRAEITSLSSSVHTNYLKNTTDTLTGNLTVTGFISSSQIHTEYVTSSIVLATGSNQFGDEVTDIHTFTGSVNISGSQNIIGDVIFNNDLTIQGDLDVTGTLNATVEGTTATASYVEGANVDGAVTNASTASFVTFNNGLSTTSDVQFDSLGVGAAATGTTGEIVATGDITAYYSSDERLKDNITPLSNALDKINQIGGYEFDWNDNSSHSGHDVGVIAQEIEKVLPEVVVDRDTGYKAVRYEKIVALLIQAIKEQQLQIDELKSKI